MDIKRIQFERTGGFAGIRFAADFALGDLPDEQAHTLTELLDDLDFDELPEQILGDQQVADGFTYSITVVTEKRQHTVVTGEASAPEKMHDLVQLLNEIARSRAKRH